MLHLMQPLKSKSLPLSVISSVYDTVIYYADWKHTLSASMFVLCVVCINISLDVHQTVMWAVSAGRSRGHWPPHAAHTFSDSGIFLLLIKNMGYLFFSQILWHFTFAQYAQI